MRDNLRRVVDYAANPEKTEYGALSQALHYAGNNAKTTLPESAKLVSGIHCRPETAWSDMRAVQRKFGKTEGVVAMHAYQSFQPGEVTPEQCHAIGVELARQVWGGRFQVLVATHMNTHCLHNHFVINAVSYVDGKKYEQRRSQYRELRRASDALCRAQGIEVVLHSQPWRSDTVRLGMEALQADDLQGVMFCPADQPLLEQDTVKALALWGACVPGNIRRTVWQGKPGAPVLFPAWAFGELLRLPQGKGGGVVAKAHSDRVDFLEAGSAAELADVVRPVDLEAIRQLLNRSK